MSVTVRMDPKVKAAIATINDRAWTPIEYTDAVYDEATGTWVSRAVHLWWMRGSLATWAALPT